MILKFQAMIATNKPDIDGEVLSISALESIREQAVGKNVSVNFIHTLDSNVVVAYLNDVNELFVEGVIDLERSPLGVHQGLYIVPGYIVDDDGEFEQLVELSLTFQPADKNLTPVDFYEFTRD